MTTRLAALVLLLTPVTSLHAQVGVPGSTRYRTASIAGDVRASWANPAGLASFPEASVMAEFRYDRPSSGGGRLGQYTLGLNSRGFSLIYQRDRFENGNIGNTYRVGVANPFSSGALGIAYTLYKGSGPSATGFDVGVRYRPHPMLDLGAVVRQIGRPFVRGQTLPVTGVGSATYLPAENLAFSLEVTASERLTNSGVTLNYRGLVNVVPLSGGGAIIGVVDINQDLAVTTFGLGFSYGSGNQGLVMGVADRSNGTTRLGSVSLTGVASQQFLPGR